MGHGKLILMGMAGAALPALVLIALILRATGGVWEYALDDVYIHLAMSEGLLRGEYGVNAGEPASASSSILYSYLLAPFAGTGLHVWWPLVIGLASLLAAGALWGDIMAEAAVLAPPERRWLAPALALLAPVFLHFPAMSVIGMEHMAHVAATLAVLAGLLRFARDGQLGWLLVGGLVLNPLLRFEGVAVLVLGTAVIAFSGRPRAALAILSAALLPLAAHFWHMASLGLDMLPNSVNAKAAVAGGGERAFGAQSPTRWEQLTLAWGISLLSPSGRMLVTAVLVFGFGLLIVRRQLRGIYAMIGWMAVLAALAHVTLGSAVWFYRYEVYVWSLVVGAGAVCLCLIRTESPALSRALPALFALSVAYGGAHYLPTGFVTVPQGSAAIKAQQRQMGRFVDAFWQAPVAVNDLGHVAYDNPHYVLDLWGLASAEALERRLAGDDPLWADDMARRYGVDLAMIYDHWLEDAIGPGWVEVARLELTIPLGTLGGPVVTLYATREEAVAPVRAALERFAPTLDGTSVLKMVENGE